MKIITEELIEEYREHMYEEEKADATIEKYIRDITALAVWLDGRAADKKTILDYKYHLTENYALTSVNSMLSSLNSFFVYNEWSELKTKFVKVQKQIFAENDKELTKAEYKRLLAAAKNRSNERLYLLMQTICATGIRVSELKYITVEAVNKRRADIRCKGKARMVLIPENLCIMLKRYIKKHQRKNGCVFISKGGRPLDRSNIWSEMKKLCEYAGISANKVFPHNLRHLFARTYYRMQKDIVRLADILGHSNINTTRIYTMETVENHRRQIQQLGLLRC